MAFGGGEGGGDGKAIYIDRWTFLSFPVLVYQLAAEWGTRGGD